MTDTTNTEPPLRAAFEAWAAKDEPPYKLERAPDPFIYAWGSTACAWKAFEAGAAHAVAQMQGEPVAWMSTVMCIGPDYGKVRFDKLPIQSLQEGYYSHTPLYTAPATAEQPQAREITDAEIDALMREELSRGVEIEWNDVHRIVRAAIALANGRG